MFQKFHAMREEREGGFTLIELLVVILIIAILAAIAIPVFLNQRKKGWISQTESALKNMATAEESWLTANSQYTSSVPSLQSEGFTYSSADVTPSVIRASGTDYCMIVTSVHDTTIFRYYSSAVGRPSTTPCT
jgi:type IV pilus assembly protein PilA